MARDTEKLLAAIDAASQTAYGSDEGLLTADRAYAINLYLGQNVDPVPEGRSSVVDRSVFETIQWILPSLCRIFASGDDVVSVPPLGPDDEEAAKQEGQYLNFVITQKNAWFDTFLTWATDALLTKNAYVLAYNDTSRQIEVERYERQTAEGLALLLQDSEVEVISSKQYPDPDAQPQPMVDPATGQPAVDPMTGQPMMQPPTMLFDVEIRRVNEKKKQCLKVLAPERVRVSEQTPSFRMAECPYFEYWEAKTISDLRAEGFDVEDDIAADTVDDELEDVARDLYNENTTNNEYNGDPSMRRVKARAIWIRHDFDGDGIAELQYVVRVGAEILYREEVSRIPVACIVPNPLPHRHMGLSIADITADIQRIKTAILRQGLDNLYLSNNPVKVANTDHVNLDDLLVSRPGHVVRVTGGGSINDAYRHEVPPFVFPQALEGLEYMDQIRENRTGTNRYFTGIDQNALNKTATGIQTLSTMAAQRVEQIARIFASGIEDLFSIVHELILKAGHKTEVVQLRGQWVEVNPATWRKRTDFRISVGFAAGNKDAMVSRLAMIRQAQLEYLQLGVPVVTPENVYETAIEMTKAGDFSSPERFWTDPQKIPPKPPQEDPALALEKIKAQKEIGLKQADIEMQDKELSANSALEKYKIDTQATTQLALAHMSHNHGMEATNLSASLDTSKQMEADDSAAEKIDESNQLMQAIHEGNAEQTAELRKMLQQFTNSITTMAKAMSAPREVIRDKAGKIIGAKSV